MIYFISFNVLTEGGWDGVRVLLSLLYPSCENIVPPYQAAITTPGAHNTPHSCPGEQGEERGVLFIVFHNFNINIRSIRSAFSLIVGLEDLLINLPGQSL